MPTKSAISFGLVYMPVTLHSAVIDNDIHFNQLRRGSTDRVKYKKTCDGCDRELTNDEIVRGYEYDRGKYVVITDDELEKIKTEKDRAIYIIHFAKLSEIDTVFFGKTYHVVPEKGGEKAYELLRRAMQEKNRVAIARTVLGSTDTLLTLIPHGMGITAQTLLYSEDLRDEPPKNKRAELTAAEINMAQQLISNMEAPFKPEIYHNEYQKKVRELIEAKVAGSELPNESRKQQTTVVDLMEALQLSLKQQEKPEKTKTTAKRAKPETGKTPRVKKTENPTAARA